jgi:MOSC domain-containing protein YiiM
MTARIDHIFLKVERGQPMAPMSEAVAEAGRGLVGDSQYGSHNRQVLLIDNETLREFGLSPGDVRENLTTSGLDATQLLAGVRLRIGQTTLEVTGDCAPCSMMDELRDGLQHDIEGRRGVLARVIEGGQMRVGDRVVLDMVASPAAQRARETAEG